MGGGLAPCAGGLNDGAAAYGASYAPLERGLVPSFLPGSNRHIMANNDSARKRIRQTAKRTARNKARKSRVRSFVRKVEEAVASGDKAAAQEAFRAAQPEMQRAATKGVVHANTVARKLSRLSARVKNLGA